MKKKVLLAVIVLCACVSLFTSSALAHSGGLDKNGGHWNHKTGHYHYHR